MNILIVDDDPTSRILLGATLKKLGHQVAVASSAEEVLAALERGPVPLLISDMVMPGMSGPDLAAHLLKRLSKLKNGSRNSISFARSVQVW